MNARALHPIFELALAQAATFAFPLVFAVVCGRNLGLEGYGEIAFYTALGGFLGVIVEFGFDWLGIREVTQNAADAEHCRQTLLHITAVRLALALIIGALMSAALWGWKGGGKASLIIGTWAYLLGFAFDVGWFLRAIERTRLLLLVTLVARAAGIALLVALVSGPADQALAIWIYAFVVTASSALAWLSLWRLQLARGPWRLLRARLVGLLRNAFAILLGNLNGAMLGHGGVALLGLVSEPATVGAASLALRVKMAALAVLLPIQQWSFVRLSRHAHTAPALMRSEGRRTLAALMVIGAALALAATAAAPKISQIVFHEAVPAAIALIGLLALSIPVHSAGNLFGVQSLVALGRERSFALILCAASVLFCSLLPMLKGPLAYGWALLAAEGLILLACGLTVRHALLVLEAQG
ncbi:MAG: oligosaccharide flippase family protein [Burkholderiales bacterium]|nr:oligosaccharide flippase family protein [Burkholderiales bacterium]